MGTRRIQHDGLSLEVEDSWVDASQLAFVAPADQALSNDLTQRAAAAGVPKLAEIARPKSPGNLLLTFRPRPERFDLDARTLAEQELRAIVAGIPGATAETLEWSDLVGDTTAILEVAIEMDGLAARQLHALTVLEDRLFHFVGTSGSQDYKRQKDVFLAALTSIRLDSDEEAPNRLTEMPLEEKEATGVSTPPSTSSRAREAHQLNEELAPG